MYSDIFFLLTAVSVLAYTYCLLRVHFLAVKLDRCTGVPRSGSGEIRVADLQHVKAAASEEYCVTAAQTAITNLRISNFIAISYLTGLALYACMVCS